MTLSTKNLTGGRVLVKGEDIDGTFGETVLDGNEWAYVKAQRAHSEAHDDFDQAVEEFFAPLMEASAKLESSLQVAQIDPISYLVIDEGEEPVEGRQATVVKLSKDSIVLRLLEQGDQARLVWVDGSLEVLETLGNAGGGDSSDAQSDGGVANGEPVTQ